MLEKIIIYFSRFFSNVIIMSINTLKRKTQAKYNNVSVNKNQFSINGGTRNQGWVGQTTLSRTVNRTLFRDGFPRGSGGKYGNFVISTVISSDINTTENSSVIKKSVLSTYGQLETEYRPEMFITVKPDGNNNLNDQSDYIENLRIQTVNNVNNCDISGNLLKENGCTNKTNCYNTATNYNNQINNSSSVITKTGSTVISSGDYITNLQNKCYLDNKFYIPNTLYKTPLPGLSVTY
jgi:hypothetical protein